MATPTRIANVARRIFFRSTTQGFLSWHHLSRGVNRILFQNKTKATLGLLSFPAAFISSQFVVMAGSGEDNKALIDEVEALYEKKDFHAMYDLLIPHKESKDANVLWRLARAATEKGKSIETSVEAKKILIFEAFEYIKVAFELDDNNFACHKWYGILLDYTGEYEGTKQRISNAFKVKEHFLKAIELNPKDATTMYCLGMWCFLFADMSWVQRKVAGVVFASPPTSTYEEALKHFEDAEKAEPGFYNQNNIMRARIMLKMKGDKEQIKEILFTASGYDAGTEDDRKAVVVAKEMLAGDFKIKV